MLSINFKGMSKLLSLRNNTRTFAVAFIALLTLSAVVAILPAFAKTYTAVPDRETMTDVGTSPKLIGLGQEITINIITYPAPSGPTYSLPASFGGRTSTPDGPPIQHANLNLSVYYKPSSSAHARTFTVQEELVLNGILNGYPCSPYPPSYWT